MTASRLPLLEPHESTLQKCVYCPKLCRASCPVGNVEASETLTPWGKMSMAYFVGRGDVPIDEVHADSAWACTGCLACRERCDHNNEVAQVLVDARADLFARGVAPAAAQAVAARYEQHAEENRAAVEAIDPECARDAKTAVLIGSGYTRKLPEEAAAVWRVACAFTPGPHRALRALPGLVPLEAGDRPAFEAAARGLLAEIGSADSVVVADPGAALLLGDYARLGFEPPRSVRLLVDVIFARIERVPALALSGEQFRYHDPCRLGRGLGRYEEPRAILARLAGAVPGDLGRSREQGECSGAGGLLPATRPDASAAIADERLAEHASGGGGVLVTACGSSLRRFRTRGADAQDLFRLVDRALEL